MNARTGFSHGLLLITLILLCGCTATPTDQTASASSYQAASTPPEIRRVLVYSEPMVDHLMDAFNRDDIPAQRRDFSPEMLRGDTIENMQTVWRNYMGIDGPYVSRRVIGVNFRPRELVPKDVVEVWYHAQFENHDMDFTVAFNNSPDHKIAAWLLCGYIDTGCHMLNLGLDFDAMTRI